MSLDSLHTSGDNLPNSDIIQSTLDIIPKSDIQEQLDELKRILAEQVLIDAIKSEFGIDAYEADLDNKKLDSLLYVITMKPGESKAIKDAILTLAGKVAQTEYHKNTILKIDISIVKIYNTPYIASIRINDTDTYNIID